MTKQEAMKPQIKDLEDKTRSNETYELRLKATDALGAFVTKAQKLSAAKPDEPPQITSVSIPSRIGAHTNITIGATATDPDGDRLAIVDENGIQLKTFTKKFMENNRKIHPTTVNEIPTVSGGNLIIDSF